MLFNARIYVPGPTAIPMHLFLLFWANPTGWKDLAQATWRQLTRRGDQRRDDRFIFTMHRRALVSYGIGCLICYNIRLIFRLLFRRIVLIPVGLLSLYRLGILDSVCINQQDPLDKTRQVAIVSKIYQQATRTLAWLGDSPTAEYAVLQLYR